MSWEILYIRTSSTVLSWKIGDHKILVLYITLSVRLKTKLHKAFCGMKQKARTYETNYAWRTMRLQRRLWFGDGWLLLLNLLVLLQSTLPEFKPVLRATLGKRGLTRYGHYYGLHFSNSSKSWCALCGDLGYGCVGIVVLMLWMLISVRAHCRTRDRQRVRSTSGERRLVRSSASAFLVAPETEAVDVLADALETPLTDSAAVPCLWRRQRARRWAQWCACCPGLLAQHSSIQSARRGRTFRWRLGRRRRRKRMRRSGCEIDCQRGHGASWTMWRCYAFEQRRRGGRGWRQLEQRRCCRLLDAAHCVICENGQACARRGQRGGSAEVLNEAIEALQRTRVELLQVGRRRRAIRRT